MPTLLVHSSLDQAEIDEVIGAVASNVKVSKHAGFNTNADVDNFFISNYKTGDPVVGLLYHNPEDGTIPFFKGVNLNNINGIMEYFCMKCKQKNVKVVDLITCNINSQNEQFELLHLSNKYNIDIRYSIDPTSDTTNWILESHNINIKPIYFSKDLPLLDLLGLSDFSLNVALSSNNKLISTGINGLFQDKIPTFIFNADPGYIKFESKGGNYYILNNDGSLTVWGSNSYGEVKDYLSLQLEPMTDTTYNFKDIITSDQAVIVKIDDNGIIKAATRGRDYKSSNGSGFTDHSWRICIDSNGNHITDVMGIERSMFNSWILKTDGTVWGCGDSTYNQLTGHGTTERNYFVQIQRKTGATYAPLTGITKLCVGGGAHYGACAITNTGSVLIWGRGGNGLSSAVECGEREISIPGETIVDVFPYEEYTNSNKVAYIRTATGNYYTLGIDENPIKDNDISPGSSLIGGNGNYVTKIVRGSNGIMALVSNGDVLCRGKFYNNEAPYSRNVNGPWIKHPDVSNIADIHLYSSTTLKIIDHDRNVKALGYLNHWDYGFNPYIWRELDHIFVGKIPVQWAVIGNGHFVAILDDKGDVYIRTLGTKIGSIEPFTELFITGNATQIVAAENYGVNILKKDGTTYYWGKILANEISNHYTLQQWGGIYKDTTKFVMIAASHNIIYSLDDSGNVYCLGKPGSGYITPTTVNQTTIIKAFDDYKTIIESWAGPNNKIIGIYARHKALFMVFEGGFVCPVGHSTNTSVTNCFGNGTRNGYSSGYVPILSFKNVISITATGSGAVYTTATGHVYGCGVLTGVVSRKSNPYNCTSIGFLYGTSHVLLSDGDGAMYKKDDKYYITGIGANMGVATNVTLANTMGAPSVNDSADSLLSSIGITDFTIKEVNRNFVYGGATIEANINNIISNFSENGLRNKVKEFILEHSSRFNKKSITVEGAHVLNLFNGSFATELQSSSRKVRMKARTGRKYILDSTDLTGLGNGEVLYIADEGSSTGTDIILNIGGTDYTYTLFTDKITYNSTDYVIGDSITFGTLNLVVKGLSSTEFIQEGTSGGSSSVPCFGGNTYIQTPTGPVMIKDLKNGDLVNTNEGPQPVIIHKSTIAKTKASSAPYVIKKHAFSHNVPNQDTIVSPTHMLLFNGNKFSHPMELSKYTDNVYQLPTGSKQHYYNIETPNYLNHIISANNLMAEPYAAKQIPKTHQLLFVKQSGPFFNRVVVPKSSIPHLLK